MSETVSSAMMSQGDIADKITILELKAKHGGGTAELDALRPEWKGDEVDLNNMRVLNQAGWDVVGRIHQYFDGGIHGDARKIIEDCFNAHRLNKIRVEFKNRINKKFGQHEEYKTWKPSTT